MPKRIEKDFIGEVEVPNITYFGMQTVRAIESFNASELKEPVEFIISFVQVKKACALANIELEMLSLEKGNAIIKACDEIIAGAHFSQFAIDVFHAGGGTSLNMNINEVIANRALEILAYPKGTYGVLSPFDDVNMSQADTDVFSTALRVALLSGSVKMLNALGELKNAFLKKSIEFDLTIKAARAGFQDSVPMTLGQEFLAFAEIIKKSAEDIDHARGRLKNLNIGGTEVGTGLNTHANFQEVSVRKLCEITKLSLEKSENMVELAAFSYDFMNYSAQLKNLALNLIKISSDICVMASGPNTGLNEIRVPPVHAGSSAVPGMVAPAMLEMLSMVGMQVMGADYVVAQASAFAPRNLNIYIPVISYNMLFAQKLISNSVLSVTDRCIPYIKANDKVLSAYFESTSGHAAVLLRKLGYSEASKLVQEARMSKRTVLDLAIDRKLLSDEELEKIRAPRKITEPGLI
ncbi:MAG TPA: lyase family protein [Candidatus Wallbacteria bacterium]|nr:lyase family protein [Candidatus Wallbacteria bacterium]